MHFISELRKHDSVSPLSDTVLNRCVKSFLAVDLDKTADMEEGNIIASTARSVVTIVDKFTLCSVLWNVDGRRYSR